MSERTACPCTGFSEGLTVSSGVGSDDGGSVPTGG